MVSDSSITKKELDLVVIHFISLILLINPNIHDFMGVTKNLYL